MLSVVTLDRTGDRNRLASTTAFSAGIPQVTVGTGIVVHVVDLARVTASCEPSRTLHLQTAPATQAEPSPAIADHEVTPHRPQLRTRL